MNSFLNFVIFFLGFAAGYLAYTADSKELDKPVPIFTNEQAIEALDCLAKEQGE